MKGGGGGGVKKLPSKSPAILGLKIYNGHFLIKVKSKFNIEVSTITSCLKKYVLIRRITFSISSQLIKVRLRALLNESKSKALFKLTSEYFYKNIQYLVKWGITCLFNPKDLTRKCYHPKYIFLKILMKNLNRTSIYKHLMRVCIAFCLEK